MSVPIGAARLFGPGRPTGAPAELAIRAGRIEVRTTADALSAPLDALRLREVGTGESGLELSWTSADGLYAVQVFDREALARLRAALASTPQMAALQASARRIALGRSLGWAAIVAFIALPLILLAAFLWQADRIAAALAARIPVEHEMQLGAQAFEVMRPSLDLLDDGPAVDAVRSLGGRLTQGSRYTYRFHVARSGEVNAFALPGGVIVVHSGLIEATRRPEELAGVLAHEIQHVERRHSLQILIQELGLRGLWLLATGDVVSGALAQATLQLTSLGFSREAEAQADAEGFDALVSQGVDPSGMADFFETLAQRQSIAPPAFLSTHPPSAARAKALRAREQALGARTFEPLDVGPWPPR